ncbi:MAG: EAL domain-containing protein [Frankiales bacterium]|nr:EAL domain-containing protein [Frankiales bacterium]
MYAAVSLVLVALLGAVLAANLRAETERRGIDQGVAEALLLGRTAIEAHLDGRAFTEPLSTSEVANLETVARRAIASGDMLRLRLRDLSGHVVWSDDGLGYMAAPDDEVLEAARGRTVARITRLGADGQDVPATGVEAIEVYAPLHGGSPLHQLGVLEIYLPYGPIVTEVESGMGRLYRDLAVGLLLLWVGLFLVSLAVSRGLRSQLRLNRHLAEHDPLTDLPNRAAFRELVARAVAAGDGPVAVAIVDLDRFKEVNDTLGHQYGDHLLTELADRLRSHICGRDRVARLGGDEFGVVLRDAADPDAALWRVREVIESEVRIDGLPISLNSSIGYAVAPADGREPDALLQRADVAMYVAKSRHLGVVRYDEALDHHDAENLELLYEVRRALRENELVLHYQPKVRLEDGGVVAIESLVRWEHPTLGTLAPDRFVPLVEQTDLIDELTEWVLHRALGDLASLGGRRDLTVAVNVSARNLSRLDFAERVAAALTTSGVPADRLVVEITETALLSDPARAAVVLLALSELGVRVSLDDFGVGQTSLAHLASLPVDELKIDRGFVTDMVDDHTHAAIVRSIVDLAHSLALRVVAEGVETTAASSALRDVGCDLAQGFLYSRPVPLADLRTVLADDVAVRVP